MSPTRTRLAACILALVALTGCESPVYPYLDLPPSASNAELQAAWDAKFPPGTSRADLLAAFPSLGVRNSYSSDDGRHLEFWSLTGTREFGVHVDVYFDSSDQIESSEVFFDCVVCP